MDSLVHDLDQRRAELGLTKAELARLVGVQPAAIRRLFSAEAANPQMATLTAIADALGATLRAVPRNGEQPPVLSQPLDTVRRMGRAVIFDGDDTLWAAEHLYDDARAAAAQVVAQAGLDPGTWDAMQRATDLENVARMGLSKQRFPTSCVEAYRALAAASGGQPDDEVAAQVRHAATSVFRRKAPLAPGARMVLERLRPDFSLVLLTQGDHSVQRKRIRDSQLAALFDVIEVVPAKTIRSFQEALAATGAAATDSWSVGNSLPSDINPALALGLSAVWLDTHVWEHERREVEPRPGPMVRAERLEDVPRIVAAGALVGRP